MEETELNQKSDEKALHRLAKIPVSLRLLEQMLPMGTQILGADFNKAFGVVEIMVAHPSFEALNDGDIIPTRTLMVYSQFCDTDGGHRFVSKVNYAE